MIQPAERLSLVSEYYFSRKLKEVAQLNAEGKDIISLAIGSPDMPPSEQTVNKLCEVARQPDAHGYQPTMGTPELRQAMAGFYKRWYDVDLDARTEVLPLIGSKEGILHVTLAFVNPGDVVLVPNPGYPTYTSLSKILGASIVNYDLREDNGWQPDFDQLEEIVRQTSNIRLLWLSQHADRRTRPAQDLRTAGAVCQRARHRRGQRQSLFVYPERGASQHPAGAWCQGLLHRVQLDVEVAQHARLACGTVRYECAVHLMDSQGAVEHRERHVPRYSAGCRRGLQQQRRVASDGERRDLQPSSQVCGALQLRPTAGGHVPLG